jgi:hypothetical protein
VRAPKNSISLPPSNLPPDAPPWNGPAAARRSRRRHSVIARIGALPVPVQIITMWLAGGWASGSWCRTGPITCTLSPTFRSHM